MLNLKEYRGTADRLADHLPWAALVAPGVVLNKDGSFQRTLRFRGPDLESAPEAELLSVCARANNALRRLGSGWAFFFDAERIWITAEDVAHLGRICRHPRQRITGHRRIEHPLDTTPL